MEWSPIFLTEKALRNNLWPELIPLRIEVNSFQAIIFICPVSSPTSSSPLFIIEPFLSVIPFINELECEIHSIKIRSSFSLRFFIFLVRKNMFFKKF